MTAVRPPVWYRIQKSISVTLIFAILFGQTVQIPLFERANASRAEYPNLVSILVPEKINSGDLKSAVKQYARDIQGTLEGSRAVIIELPDDITPEKIAAINEKLYYEGDGNDSARLVGTVLVGNIPLPVVHNNEKTFLSVFPYVDFTKKAFVYSTTKGYYEASGDSDAKDEAEIWHGLIAPNTGSYDDDTEKLVEFFEKSHAFYEKSGMYSSDNTRSEPYVFMFDAYHDQISMKSEDWKAYQLGMEYLEDISYNRFNKHLAKTLYDKYQDIMGGNVDTSTLTGVTDIVASSSGGMDFSNTPDVQTKTVIEKIAKTFAGVLNEKYIGELLRYVYNTGRYGDGSKVRGDVAAGIIAKEDSYMAKMLVDVTSGLESSIDSLVKNGLSRNIPIATSYSIDGISYSNYFMGRKAETVTAAQDCTIVRGSSLRVEANHGYNMRTIKDDYDALANDNATDGSGGTVNYGARYCTPTSGAPKMQSYWGGNHPLNANFTEMPITLGKYYAPTYSGFSKSIFDIAGSKEISASSTIAGLTQNSCFAIDLLKDPSVTTVTDSDGGSTTVYYPSNTNGKRFGCDTDHETATIKTFATYYNEVFSSELTNECTSHSLTLDGKEVFETKKSYCPDKDDGEGGTTSQKVTAYTYSFKKIPSIIEHKSPTLEELATELTALTTPSLPIDKDRSVSFLSAKGNEASIIYPNFFRIELDANSLTKEKALAKIKEVLDTKSAEINAIIQSENPSSLSGKSAEIYNLLKTGEYPNGIDLYGILAKNATTLDALASAVIWNNLDSATAKYAYVLEHFVDTDGNSIIPLPGHKNDYEIAYIGGEGDASNLYLKMEPTEEVSTDLSDIIAKNNALQDGLSSMNGPRVSNSSKKEDKCSPKNSADGVPLEKWLQAVKCWAKNELVPVILPGSCGSTELSDLLKDEKTAQLSVDLNGNGIPDALEDANGNGILDGQEIVKDGSIEITAPAKRFSKNSSLSISATLYNKNHQRILVDSGNDVVFSVTKIVDRSTKNPTVVYNANGTGALLNASTIQKYLITTTGSGVLGTVRVTDGLAEFGISSQNINADITLEAKVAPLDKKNRVAFIKLATYDVAIRDEKIALHFTDDAGETIGTGLEAGSTSGLHMSLSKTVDGQSASLSYPVTLRVFNEVNDAVIGDPIVISGPEYVYKNTLLNTSGNYRFEFKENNGTFEQESLAVTAGGPKELRITPVSNVFVKQEKDTVLVQLIDAFGNLVSGTAYSVKLSLSGGGYFDENKADTLEKIISEGYATLDISSNNSGENITVQATIENPNLSTRSGNIRTIENAKISLTVADAENIIAGSGSHDVSVSVLDANGIIIPDFNGYVSLNFPANLGTFDTTSLKITNGVSEGVAKLTPGHTAAQGVVINAEIPGIQTISGNVINIHNNVPMRIELSPELTNMEAHADSHQTITLSLLDRYGNVASYKTEGYTANLSIPSAYQKFLTLNASQVVFNGGLSSVVANATLLPGISYVVAEIQPWLESNTASLTDANNSTVTLSGVSKNVVKIYSTYFWNASKLDKTDYNALYTVLVGGAYGNVTEQNYLAGELLFRANSRTLAVTSLLSRGTTEEKTASFTPAGKTEVSDPSFTSTVIGQESGRTTLSLVDDKKSETIAKAFIRLGSNADFVSCNYDGKDGVDNCNVAENSNSYAIVKAMENTSVLEQNGLVLLDQNKEKIVQISADGSIQIGGNVQLELDTENTKNFLALKVMRDQKELGYLALKMRSEDIIVVPFHENIAEILAAKPNSFVIQSVSPNYFTQKEYLGNSSFGKKGVAFYLTDSESNTADKDLVGGSNKLGYESYYEQKGIGWEGDNKAILDFAGGSTVGEANRFYASFSTVNLGDPVLSVTRSGDSTYDRTLGSRIFQSNDDPVEFYRSFDYNNDGLQDIVAFLSSGKIRLLENEGGSFRDLGDLAYVADAGEERKDVGDFEKDGYDDIVFVQAKTGEVTLLVNHQGKFTRTSIRIKDEQGKTTSLSGKAINISVFDMDQDGYDDIVVLDDAGVLSTLYGGMDGNGLIFTRKIVTTSLGFKVSTEATDAGAAIRYDGFPTIKEKTETDYAAESGTAVSNGTMSESEAKSIVDAALYYTKVTSTLTTIPFADNDSVNPNLGGDESTSSSEGTSFSDIAEYGAYGSTPESQTIAEQKRMSYIRSEFSEAKNIPISKYFVDTNGSPLQSGDKIQTRVLMKNDAGKTLNNVRLLDNFETKATRLEETGYSLHIYKNLSGALADFSGKIPSYSGAIYSATGTITELDGEEFNLEFAPFTLLKDEVAIIQYTTVANTLAFKKFVVGSLDGIDNYGDIGMSLGAICGTGMTIWRSGAAPERKYEQTTQSLSGDAELPEALKKMQDLNGNGVPDAIEDVTSSISSGGYSGVTSYASSALSDFIVDNNSNGIPDKDETITTQDSMTSTDSDGGISLDSINATADAVDGQIQDIIKWLGCGFGGGSCISSPLNYAPLAPGSSPTVLGYPVAPNLMMPGNGLPIFSFPTIGPVNVLGVPIPPLWPTNYVGAGGWFDGSPTGLGISQFRIFITPTVTGAVGTAICFGSNSASLSATAPGMSPLVPGGNCIVAAMPLNSCKDDGSDGNIASAYSTTGSGVNSFINANACTPESSSSSVPTNSYKGRSYTIDDYKTLLNYAKNGTSAGSAAKIAGSKSLKSLSTGPLISIGGTSGDDSNLNVSLDMTALKNFNFGEILKIKNGSIPAFPDFLMDWMDRQMDEIINKLTSLPTLFIILPDFGKLFEEGWGDFGNNLKKSFENGKKSSDATSSQLKIKSGSLAPFREAKTLVNNSTLVADGKKFMSGMKGAYEFLSKLPVLALEPSTVEVDIPIIAEEEIQKNLLVWKQWQKELQDKKQKWGALLTKSSGSGSWEEKASLDMSTTLSDVNTNIKTLESYSEFPAKLQKFFSWKKDYTNQIICNLETIENVMGGWIGDNGKRFKAWVEFYILVKAILKSWQPLLDVFTGYKDQYGTCKNERYDLKYFIFKLISSIIPSFPIIQFPKLPDIILDLHNVRMGIRIAVPEYSFHFTPIVLPQLPKLSLPEVPTAGVSLPGIPKLPKLPELPNLPNLPSLPNVVLPVLPPPPKLPKMFGAVTTALTIFRLIAKILGIMSINPFVPEWRAGDQIAQITERTGTLKLDFLKINYPNFKINYLKAIKITTLVNLEFQADFILEMMKARVDMVNRATADMRSIGKISFPDIVVPGVENKQIDLQGSNTNQIEESKTSTKNIADSQNISDTELLAGFAIGLAEGMKEFISYMNEQKNDLASTDEMKSILISEAKKLRSEQSDARLFALADSLEWSAQYSGKNEDALTATLLQESKEKFAIVQQALQKEVKDTTKLENQFREFFSGKKTNILGSTYGNTVKIAAIGQSNNLSDANTALTSYNNRTKNALLAMVNPEENSELEDIGSSIKNQMNSISNSITTESFSQKVEREKVEVASSSSTSTVASSTTDINSSYSYRGIYYFESGKQKRLFDYTEELDGTEHVAFVNVASGEEQKSIVYRMGNALYVKYPVATKNTHINTSSADTVTPDDVLDTNTNPSAPNYFTDKVVGPETIEFSFAPANVEKDTKFHLEFYDYIERFSSLEDGGNPETLPESPLHSIDLFANDTNLATDTTKPMAIIGKTPAIIQRGNGEVSGTIPEYITFESGKNFTLSNGKNLYALDGNLRIQYRKDETTEWELATIPKYQNIVFADTVEVKIIEGIGVIWGDSFSKKTADVSDLIGYPVITGTDFTLHSNGFVSIRYDDESIYRIDRSARYTAMNLGDPAENYSVSISRPNDFYYARLYAFGDGKQSAKANLTLLAPQVAGDTTGPINTDLGEVYSLPIYTEQLFIAKNYFSDISGISSISADLDLTKDSDGDGNLTNDIDTNSGSFVRSNGTPGELMIGSFDAPAQKKIRLFVTDGNGNVTEQNLTISAYSPIPTITSNDKTSISGKINGTIKSEPIDIMRVRGGNVSRLEPDQKVFTDNNGLFTGNYPTGENLSLKNASGAIIASVDESSGIIHTGTGMHIDVIGATEGTPLSLVLKNEAGSILYTEQLSLGSSARIEQVELGKNPPSEHGLYATISGEGLDFVRNTSSAQTLPNGAFLVNSLSHKAIIGIGSDGNIYIIDTSYTLSYQEKSGHIAILVKNSAGEEVARFEYIISGEFILR